MRPRTNPAREESPLLTEQILLARRLRELDRPEIPYLPGAWHWRASVFAPDGNPIPGAEGDSPVEAIGKALAGHHNLWAYALTQGYRLKWVRTERDAE